jgi:calcineurin-like phosphoesterase family protein
MSEKTFFIADTHFGDDSILRYENRPFRNIHDMDNSIISNWNNTVSDNDTVFLLGDFSAYQDEKLINLCTLLKGNKFLVMGNHDTKKEEYYYKCGFKGAYRFPIIYNDFWILSHEPLYINSNMPYTNIFGHVHNSPLYKDFSNQSFCVSAERINYTPLEFNEIKSKMGIIQ